MAGRDWKPVRVLVAALLISVVLAGCAANEPLAGTSDELALPVDTGHALQNASTPGALTAPVFQMLGAIAAGGPVYGAGEPSAWVAPDGTLYAAFPGCDRGAYLVPDPTPGAESCGHGLIYRSTDGQSWERLNRDGDGRYTEDGPAANGDADVAVDAAGNVYASNLGSGIQFHTYWAENQTWEYMANVVPEGEGADRQWMAAGKEGHVIMTWMRTSPERDVAINVTFDGGRTWTHAGNFGGTNIPGSSQGIGWLSTVQIAPDGKHAYIAYTQPTVPGTVPIASGPVECAMRVLVSSDGGRNWTDIDTGARWTTSQTGGHWSCSQMTPGIDVTGDGTVVIAWAQDRFFPEEGVPMHGAHAATHLRTMASRDGGFNWTDPEWYSILGMANHIMPWVTGGAGDRVAITYLMSLGGGDADYVSTTWEVRALVLDGVGTSKAKGVDVFIEDMVHAGGICTRGGACLITGSDRAFLDFFEADITPDGKLFVTYPHDLNPQKMIEIKVAISDGVLI